MPLNEMNLLTPIPSRVARRALSATIFTLMFSASSMAFAQEGGGDEPATPPVQEDEQSEEEGAKQGEPTDPSSGDKTTPDEGEEGSNEEDSTGEKMERIYRSLKEKQDGIETAPEEEEEAQPLTPEQEFEETFQVQRRREYEAQQQSYEEDKASNRRTFIVYADQANPPQLEWNSYTECFHSDDYETLLHAQCDHDQKTCLMAETRIVREAPSREDGAAQLSRRIASRQDYCARSYPLSALDMLIEQGYTLTPALLAAPYGYKRDERGRIFQRFFDLKSRAVLGVGYAGVMNDTTPYTSTLRVETRSSYEHLSTHDARRHRFRFLEGSLTLDPMRIDASLFNYERGRAGREPFFYITELIGEPTRYDVYAHIGYGVTFLRYDRRALSRALEKPPVDNPTLAMPTTQSLLDIMHVYLQWELFQDLSLEDFFALRLGGGVGTRARGEDSVYVYPEIGFAASWLKSPRGLFELSTRGKMRYIVEPSSNTAILAADVTASAEWVFLTISDQPVSLFLEPRLDWMSYRDGEAPLQELRVTSGVRFSLFTPAPKNPILYTEELSQ